MINSNQLSKRLGFISYYIVLGSGIIGLGCLPASALGFRTIDGSGNNLTNPDWGKRDTQLRRLISSDYGDRISMPSGSDRPSARVISNGVSAQLAPMPNSKKLSNWFWQWGQFLDHDLDLTEPEIPLEPFNIRVPQGDRWFDPLGTGTQKIGMSRSIYDRDTGTDINNPRQQINQITAYIDGSVIYGSDEIRANGLRTLDGTGKLVSSPGKLLMYNTLNLPNTNSPRESLFLSGDIRANEQVGLTAVHTLLMREHNRLADEIRAKLTSNDPILTQKEKESHLDRGDFIYEIARKIVGAQIQVITYNEFLPLLLGKTALDAYQGYDDTVNVAISHEFSTAAYRFGHSMLTSNLLLVDPKTHHQHYLPLREAFFNPEFIAENGIDALLLGLAHQQANELDPLVVDDVRNFLFGRPGMGGFDLASLNIQRGRDHGLPSYNAARLGLGLTPAMTFADITEDVDRQNKLASVYDRVDQIDLWVGGLAEDAYGDSILGELFYTIVKDQFTRLRDGDRFFYLDQNQLTHLLEIVPDLQTTTLADIIRRNTGITKIQDNVFIVSTSEPKLYPGVWWVMVIVILISRRKFDGNL